VFQSNHSLAQLLSIFGGQIVSGHGLRNLIFQELFQKQVVDVVSAEVRVAVGGKNLEDVTIGGGNKLEDGNVESAAAEIVDGDFAALFFVKAVGERGGGGLVDEAENFEAGNFAGVLGGLALGVIEIGWDGDDGAVDRFAEVGFGPILQFAEDEGGNFGWRENLFAEHNADDILARWINAKWKKLQLILNVGGTATHEALDRINGALGLGEKPSSSRLAYDDGSVRIKAYYRRAKRAAIRASDTLRLASLRVGVRHETVCCS